MADLRTWLVREARDRFHAAAYQPPLRPKLVSDLLADASLLQLARFELNRLNDVIATRGEMADDVSTKTRNCLAEVLRQVDAAAPSGITIEQETP